MGRMYVLLYTYNMNAVMCKRHSFSDEFRLSQATLLLTLGFLQILALFTGCSAYDERSFDTSNDAGAGGKSNSGGKPMMDGATEPAGGNDSGRGGSKSDSGRSDSGPIDDSGTFSAGGGGGTGSGGKGDGTGGSGGASGGGGNAGGTGVRCSEEGGKVWPQNGHCYFPSNDSLSWYVSRDTCKNVGANLVTVTSAAEQFFIDSFIDTTTSRWIGLCNFGAAHFSWVSGETVSYENWETIEPTPTAGSGVIVQNATFKWLDKPVDALYPAICERQ